jgi:hypothetical protein
MVRVEVVASHVPVQPVRARSPSVIAAPVKLPSRSKSAVPLTPGLEPAVTADVIWMTQALWRMHSGAFVPRVPPHPVTSIGTITYVPRSSGHAVLLPDDAPDMPDALPEAAPDAPPEAAPDALPEVAPDAPPDVAPEERPDVSPEPAPEVLPDALPEEVPDVSPEPPAEVLPDAPPEEVPDGSPELVPDAPVEVPDVSPEVAPDAPPDDAPEPPDAVPAETPDDCPEPPSVAGVPPQPPRAAPTRRHVKPDAERRFISPPR